MKATELRIGNWVNINWGTDKGQIEAVQIRGIEFDDGDYWFDVHNLNMWDITHLLEPIPLTEEWLIKFGFKQWGSYKELWKVGRNHNCTVRLNKWHCDMGKYIVFTSNYPVEINHVHQLQNIYFALTGEELTLKDHE